MARARVAMAAPVAFWALGCDHGSSLGGSRAADASPTLGVVAAARAGAPREGPRSAEHVVADEVAVAGGTATTVHLGWRIPSGSGVNPDAPFHVRWMQSDGVVVPPPAMKATGADVQAGFDVSLTPIDGVIGGRLVGEVDIVVCDVATHRVCVPVRREIELPFRVEKVAAPGAATLPLPEAKP